ncbi:Poly ADP-ribose polymerase 1 [Hondaea fermentalgiana]|uniref:Poly ADP-ribose polymerase 1 n=1 Tax=Hondaea fermentalgiana TaxID=2315210 RepID=A0A2R5GIM0_9STRA|nr:Poly ADP-ribose polymerase 1 [Hondaea fermentalgiana]|eukprot:GBG30737.1 Poly ADP-ribose polymerase 1 [Hondaea fermentalgiana]
MPATWGVEKAKSGRAACKKCKEKIQKDELRWIKSTENEKFGIMKAYQHIGCLMYPKRGEGFELSDVEGLDDLSPSERKTAKEAYEDAKSNTGKKRTKADVKKEDGDVKEEKGKKSSKKAKKESGVKVEKKESKKRQKFGIDLEEESDDVVAKYKKMNVSELKDYLRANKQLLKGTKSDLVTRCVDGEKNGRLLPCSGCGHGKLELTEHNTVQCSGYFDESVGQRVNCRFTAPVEEAGRGKWLTPEEAEEENKDKSASAKGEAAAATLSKSDLKKVEAAFKSLPEDATPRDKAIKLVKVSKQMDLAIPDDEAKALQRAGQAVMASQNDDDDYDLMVAFKDMLGEFGTAAAAKAAAKAEEENRPKARCEDNTKIANLIDELAVLEAKAKEGTDWERKVVALKLAVSAIRGATFKITSGKEVSKANSKKKLTNVGARTGEKIDEILSTGSLERVEELRAMDERGDFA